VAINIIKGSKSTLRTCNFAVDNGNLPFAYTPQDPPYPTVTLAPSTMTGTLRLPFECLSISSSFTLSDFTSM
jgi:hypothetical protein